MTTAGRGADLVAAGLVAFAGASTPALAADTFELEYFIVAGSTARQLNAQIVAKGPIGMSGDRSDGNTHWHIDWRYSLDKVPGGCTASRIVVNLNIRMIMPRWNYPANANPELVSQWNRYVTALRMHEDGHRYRSEAAAGDIRRALAQDRGARDCATLRKRLDARANQMLDALRATQEKYDRDTVHGQKQGVIRPRSTGGR